MGVDPSCELMTVGAEMENVVLEIHCGTKYPSPIPTPSANANSTQNASGFCGVLRTSTRPTVLMLARAESTTSVPIPVYASYGNAEYSSVQFDPQTTPLDHTAKSGFTMSTSAMILSVP